MKKSSLSIFVLLDNIITDTFINKIKHQTKIFTNIIPLVFSLVKMEYHQWKILFVISSVIYFIISYIMNLLGLNSINGIFSNFFQLFKIY